MLMAKTCFSVAVSTGNCQIPKCNANFSPWPWNGLEDVGQGEYGGGW